MGLLSAPTINFDPTVNYPGAGTGGGGTLSSLSSWSGTSGLSPISPASTVTPPSLKSAAGSVEMPSWLTTNPDDLAKELKDQYSSAPNQILEGADKLAKTGNRAADLAFSQGSRAASNAALDAANRAAQSGGAVASGAIKAQLQEKATSGQTDARLKIAEAQQNARVQAASISSDIAKTMASLRTGYLSNLATAYTQQRGQNLGYTSDATRSSIQQEDVSNRFSLGSQQNQIEAARLALTASGSGSAANRPPANFSTGYVTPSGAYQPGYMG